MAISSVDLGGEPSDVIRSTREVALRCMALLLPVALSAGALKQTLVEWQAEANLSQCLTDRERRFLEEEPTNEHERIQFTWMCERLTVLLWPLQFLPSLPAANEKCNWDPIRDFIPPFGTFSFAEFLERARLRDAAELLSMAAEIQKAHARGRSDRKNPAVVVPIIQERHHAINWIVGYCGQDWESVSTDT